MPSFNHCLSNHCFSAVAGSGLGYGLTPAKVRGALGINALNEAIGVKPVQGFGLELFFTFLLVLTVCAVTDPGKKVEPYGTTLAIGISIWVCHVCLVGSNLITFKIFSLG